MTAPIAAVLPRRTIRVAPGSTVIIDGTTSTSSAGETLTYAWRRLGANAEALPDTGPTLTVQAPAAGEMVTYRLTVTDSVGASKPAELTVHSRLANFTWLPAITKFRKNGAWAIARR